MGLGASGREGFKGGGDPVPALWELTVSQITCIWSSAPGWPGTGRDQSVPRAMGGRRGILGQACPCRLARGRLCDWLQLGPERTLKMWSWLGAKGERRSLFLLLVCSLSYSGFKALQVPKYLKFCNVLDDACEYGAVLSKR